MRFKIITIVILTFLTLDFSYCQRILQVEMVNDPETIKYYEGMEIIFKVKNSEDWHSRVIERIMIQEKAIIFNEGFYKLDDITAIQNKRFGVLLFSGAMTTFGTAWLGFGFIEEVARKGKQSDVKTWVIGGTAAALGYSMRKLFYKHNKPINKERYRLRLLDLSVY
jgi:hypothetical protein